MKTNISILVIVFALFAAPSFAAAPKPTELVHVLSTKRYVFHYKVASELIGATVTVIDGNYQPIQTMVITQTKNILDFFNLPAGYYTIKIKKNDTEVIFEYTNFE